MQPYNIVIPLKTDEEDFWSFVNPMAYQVWICALVSIPIYILVMSLAECICNGSNTTDWQSVVGFVIRNAFHETIRLQCVQKFHSKVMWYFSRLLVEGS